MTAVRSRDGIVITDLLNEALAFEECLDVDPDTGESVLLDLADTVGLITQTCSIELQSLSFPIALFCLVHLRRSGDDYQLSSCQHLLASYREKCKINLEDDKFRRWVAGHAGGPGGPKDLEALVKKNHCLSCLFATLLACPSRDSAAAALSYASKYRLEDTTACLLAFGISAVARAPQNEFFPMHLAVLGGNFTIVQMLACANGKTLSQQDAHNRLPVDLAIATGNARITAFLLRTRDVPLTERSMALFQRIIDDHVEPLPFVGEADPSDSHCDSAPLPEHHMRLTLKLAKRWDEYGCLKGLVCRACKEVEPKLFRCARCHRTKYCSADCQFDDWLRHRKYCVARRLPRHRRGDDQEEVARSSG
eukprot:TRINITY_DN12516_c0_g1_i1.p1 TRINITY_DN12516_c0_g1~~TRINITY_DN12516_c0_g1_i1.p1  ORF type:complete len:364 (+),score=45.32 TRINITY_DN12516_c0_g1_i1:91-1182(+)